MKPETSIDNIFVSGFFGCEQTEIPVRLMGMNETENTEITHPSERVRGQLFDAQGLLIVTAIARFDTDKHSKAINICVDMRDFFLHRLSGCGELNMILYYPKGRVKHLFGELTVTSCRDDNTVTRTWLKLNCKSTGTLNVYQRKHKISQIANEL